LSKVIEGLNVEKKELTEIEIIERYLILLLGVEDKPIPSPLHLQKELFILSKANPKIGEFVTFEKHYYGPYSEDIDELIKNPVFHTNAYQLDRKESIRLTPEGREIYNKLVRDYSDNPKLKALLGMMKMIRELYDKLSKKELLFLMYITYEEYKQNSGMSDELLSPQKRKEIAKRLVEKGIITEERYEERVSAND
jgi:DNA-binding MarR family transcriptional regulator